MIAPRFAVLSGYDEPPLKLFIAVTLNRFLLCYLFLSRAKDSTLQIGTNKRLTEIAAQMHCDNINGNDE